MRLVVIAMLLFRPIGAAATEFDPKLYFNGTLDLATALSDDGLPLVNTFRRGDSPYDNLRLTLYLDVVVHPRLTVFNQVLLDPSSRSSLSSFLRSYVRADVVSNARGEFLLEAGKIPMTFGTYPDRAHSDRNALLMPPLMYHYFSSLRAGQIPASNADLLAHRGEGHSSLFTGFGGGGSGSGSGLPMIYESCWDTGIRALGALWRFELAGVLTQGTLSDPRNGGNDNNDGKQVGGRIAFVPGESMVIGGSFAHGPYLHEDLAPTLSVQGTDVEDFNQTIFGADVSFGVGHLQVYAEVARNAWQSPNIVDSEGVRTDLTNLAYYVEGKYAVKAGVYLALRYDRMTFGEIEDGAGVSSAWDDRVERWEGGLGYYVTDGVLCKLLVQRTDKAGALGFISTFGAAQLSISF